jgi:hypothetical protein
VNPETLDRLIKLLGMLGSAHDGERAAAGLKAHELIRRHGLTWADVIQAPIAERVSDAEHWRLDVEFCIKRANRLTPKERAFLLNIKTNWNGPLTERQDAWLASIQQRPRSAA